MQLTTKPYLKRRFLAGLIDYSIVYLVFVTLILTMGSPDSNGDYSITGWAVLIPFFCWFLLIVVTEQVFGSTIGNGVVGLKPLSIENRPGKPHVFQSLKRHLLDPVDMLFFGIIAIIVIKNTAKNQRIGDLWAKTIVVRDNNPT